MTQYRLLDNTVDVIEETDEFWDATSRKWKVVPREFIGERFYAVIPYRRAIPGPESSMKKVVLREWICWDNAYPDAYMLRWSSFSPTSEKSNIRKWDNAVPTGQEREIEIPA